MRAGRGPPMCSCSVCGAASSTTVCTSRLGVGSPRTDTAKSLHLHNAKRPHSKLECLTPNERYLCTMQPVLRAA